mgnify:CR=1 FL=1
MELKYDDLFNLRFITEDRGCGRLYLSYKKWS